MMEEAIKKLKQLAEDNNSAADTFEDKRNTFWCGIDPMPQDRVDNLIKTYRYWSQCLYMAAWLLEQDLGGE